MLLVGNCEVLNNHNHNNSNINTWFNPWCFPKKLPSFFFQWWTNPRRKFRFFSFSKIKTKTRRVKLNLLANGRGSADCWVSSISMLTGSITLLLSLQQHSKINHESHTPIHKWIDSKLLKRNSNQKPLQCKANQLLRLTAEWCDYWLEGPDQRRTDENSKGAMQL